MDVLRTPEARFSAVPAFPYQPRRIDVGGLEMAWVEHGPPDGAPIQGAVSIQTRLDQPPEQF